LEEGVILPTLGHTNLGTKSRIQVVTSIKKSGKNSFLNVSAGLGGVNAVTLYTKEKIHHAY
jgi:3-oxoacyl-(acyl-carrier-protein) synthase